MAASLPSPNSAPLAAPPPSSSPTTPPAPPPIPVSSPTPASVASPPPDDSSPPVPATSPPPSVTSPPPVQPPSPPPVSSPPPPDSPPPTNAPPPPPPPVPALPPQTPSPPQTSPPPVPATSPPPSSNEPSTSPPTTSPPSLSPPTQISPPLSHLSPPPPEIPSLAPPPPRNSNDTYIPGTTSGLPVGGIVAIGVGGLLLVGLIGLVIWCIAAKRKRGASQFKTQYVHAYSHGFAPHPDTNLIIKTETSSTPFIRSGSSSGFLNASSNGGLRHSRSSFTYQELYEATNGFALDNLLGEGGFGPVYKGVFGNGKEVAVKQLKMGGNQGEREFKAEVEIISRIHHRHLVSLVGYCIFDSRRLLVYEYMPNQTLHYHLHEQKGPALNWATRIKIAVGAARGIVYLHEDCHPRIIHRDIKSSNILLNAKFEARVSDFGLAKLALDVDTHISTRVMGTFGYLAPEYATSGKLTDKSDVYSYGVVLLELITGRRPVDESQFVGDGSLVEWARPLLNHAVDSGEVDGLVDPRLENNYIESEMLLMIEAAAACVRHSAPKRPRMGQVIRAFDGLSPADLSNGMKVGESAKHEPNPELRLIWNNMVVRNQALSTDEFSDVNSAKSNSNPSQNVYFSAQKTQNHTFSGQSTTTHDSSGPRSQNVDSSTGESPIHIDRG